MSKTGSQFSMPLKRTPRCTRVTSLAQNIVSMLKTCINESTLSGPVFSHISCLLPHGLKQAAVSRPSQFKEMNCGNKATASSPPSPLTFKRTIFPQFSAVVNPLELTKRNSGCYQGSGAGSVCHNTGHAPAPNKSGSLSKS